MERLRRLDYSQCTVEQLQRFIGARAGTPPDDGKSKRELCECLQNLDLEFTFHRFFDLPAELRNEIYRELLTLRPSHGKIGSSCWPTILSASKKVHEEAFKVFCDENKIVLEVESSTIFSGRVKGLLQLCLNGNLFWQRMTWGDTPIGETFAMWPSMLKNLRHLTLVLRIGEPANYRPRFQDRVCERLNHLVYSLCGFMAGNRKLRRIDVTVAQPTRSSTPLELAEIVWPLARLSDAVEIRSSTFAQETEAQPHGQVEDGLSSSLATARNLLATRPRAVISADKHGSQLEKIRHRMSEMMRWFDFVDQQSDHELVDIFKTADGL